MEINETLSKIQSSLKAKKSKFNSFGKYNYRSAEDILEALKPYLVEHNVTVVINETLEEKAGLLIMNSTATLSNQKDSVSAVALVAIDMEQRGMNAPQKFGSASSYGKKYALGNLFLIDDTADSDATNTHGKTAKPKLEGAALTKAKSFIASGGSLDAIKAKYDIPADVLKTL
tara:strand:+ start:9539 stop:10057 length:519 start_codon:yes stop_codon:yes gene_type:complete